MLRHCGAAFAGPKRPVAVVRLNWNTVYCFKLARTAASYQPEIADGAGGVVFGRNAVQASDPARFWLTASGTSSMNRKTASTARC